MNSQINRKISILIALLAAGAGLLVAQNEAHLSLDGIIAQIDSAYPGVLKYDAKIQSLRAQIEGAKAWMPPRASFGLNQFPYDPMMLNDAGPMNQAGLLFSVEQMIPNSGKQNAKRNYLSSLPQIQTDNQQWEKNTFHLCHCSLL